MEKTEIFSEEESEREIPGLDPIQKRLREAWQEVLENFENTDFHSRFLVLCQKLDGLNFALDRYYYLRQALGEDPEVEKRIRQIEWMQLQASSSFQAREIQQTKTLSYWRWRWIFSILGVVLLLVGSFNSFFPSSFFKFTSFLGVFILSGLLLNSVKK